MNSRNFIGEVSGRKTRSDSTWEIQKDNLKNADSVFIYLTDSNSTLVGGAYFDMTKKLKQFIPWCLQTGTI